MTPRRRQSIVGAAVALALWAAAIFLTGGFRVRLPGVTVAARDPLRPLALAALLVAAGYLAAGRRAIDDDLERVGRGFDRVAPGIAAVAAVLAIAAGLHWGSFAASGVDAYGYVSQAALWQRGTLRVEQAFVANIPWPSADSAFAPMGYRAATSGHAIVPSYPAGLPLLMALSEWLAGACAPYYLAPIMGAVCVWCCFLIGRRVASPAIGACAAVLLVCSPPFLFHLVVPMSDVPAAALWSAAILMTLRGGARDAALAGACTALAVLVRPNLVPLAAVVGVFVILPAATTPGPGSWRTRAAWFAAFAIAAAAIVATVNWRSFGSPLKSGYDDLGDTYAVDHILVNARHYAQWLIETHSPLLVLAAAGLVLPLVSRWRVIAPRAAALFLAFTLVLTASYLPYVVFRDWYFVRYFLPALPLLLVAMLALLARAAARLPPAVRVFGAMALIAFLVRHELRFALDAGFVRVGANERRYVAVARFVEASMPANAAFLTLQHGGSIRHYANRVTLRFDLVSVGLDEALASLERAGWRPYILLEDWEETQFKAQFGGGSKAGHLDWRPMARLPEPGGVNIYDPTMAAGGVRRDMTTIPLSAACDCRHF